MSRRDALRITAIAGISSAFAGVLGLEVLESLGLHRVSSTRAKLGTLVTVTVVHSDGDEARKWVAAAFAEIDRLEALLSRYRPDTPVALLNRTGRVVSPPPELVQVLARAELCSKASGGAFDVTILPLLSLYEQSFKTAGAPPRDEEVRAARDLVDYRALDLSVEEVTLGIPGMSVTLDGIAKGYVVDRTVDILRGGGADRVMVDAGGDVATTVGLGGSPWTVGIQDPHDHDGLVGLVRLEGTSIATSGDYMRTFTEDRRMHHILDPHTGRSPELVSSVSVVARTAIDADALSTAALVLGPSDGVAMLNATPGAEGVIVTKDGERLRSRYLDRYAT